MKALLHSLLEAATLGRPVVLCTVVHSGGSAPRSAGAHMAVFADVYPLVLFFLPKVH